MVYDLLLVDLVYNLVIPTYLVFSKTHRQLEENGCLLEVVGMVSLIEHCDHGVVHHLRTPDLDTSLMESHLTF